MLGYDIFDGYNPKFVFGTGMIVRGKVLKGNFYRTDHLSKQNILQEALREIERLRTLLTEEDKKPKPGVHVFYLPIPELRETSNTLFHSGMLIQRQALANLINRVTFVLPVYNSLSSSSQAIIDRIKEELEDLQSRFPSPIEDDEIDFDVEEIEEGEAEKHPYQIWLEWISLKVPDDNDFIILLNNPSLMTFLHEYAHYLQKIGSLVASESNEMEIEARNWSHTVFFIMSPFQYKNGIKNRKFFHYDVAICPPIANGQKYVPFKEALANWQRYFLNQFVLNDYPFYKKNDLSFVPETSEIDMTEIEYLAKGMPDTFQEELKTVLNSCPEVVQAHRENEEVIEEVPDEVLEEMSLPLN